MEGLATVDGGLLLQSIHSAADGTRKMVFQIAHGPAAGGQVETVLIPISREQGSKARVTLCVSSQVGCAMNCQARGGLWRARPLGRAHGRRVPRPGARHAAPAGQPMPAARAGSALPQFCYTGRMGLQGSLTAAQIVEQVVAARRLLWEEDTAAGVEHHITPIT